MVLSEKVVYDFMNFMNVYGGFQKDGKEYHHQSTKKILRNMWTEIFQTLNHRGLKPQLGRLPGAGFAADPAARGDGFLWLVVEKFFPKHFWSLQSLNQETYCS